MIFAKLDVCMWGHPKFVAAGPAACGYWAAALAYLRGHDSRDGVLPDLVLGMLLGVGEREAKKLCERLVKAGLFERQDAGYVLLRYGAKNETAEQIDARRAERSSSAGRVAALRARRRAGQVGSHVYFVQLPSNGAIKIGISLNVGDRVAQLCSEFKERVMLLGSIPGTVDDERAFHSKLRDFRIAGEWFASTAEVHNTIREALSSNNQVTPKKQHSSNGGVPDSDSDSGSVSELDQTREGLFGLDGQAWADGVSDGTGRPCRPPTPFEHKDFIEPSGRHSGGLKGQDLVDWFRAKGRKFAQSVNPKYGFGAKHFASWLDRGEPTDDAVKIAPRVPEMVDYEEPDLPMTRPPAALFEAVGMGGKQ